MTYKLSLMEKNFHLRMSARALADLWVVYGGSTLVYTVDPDKHCQLKTITTKTTGALSSKDLEFVQ